MNATAASPEETADRVAAAVIRCRTVARLSPGRPGEVATYLPGRRVRGVAVRDEPPGPEVEVHVVGRYGPTMSEISREVEAAVHAILPGHRILIAIDDLDTDTDRGRVSAAAH